MSSQFFCHRSALYLAVAVNLIGSIVPAQAGALRGVGGVTDAPTPVQAGTLVTNDKDPVTGAADTIYDFELKELIQEHIGTAAGTDYESMILAFTQCFSGRFTDEFSSLGNTSILSATDSDNPAATNGYHAGLAEHLKPGNTTDAAHDKASEGAIEDADGKGGGDRPNKSGTNQTVGGSQSTHVLFFGGIPGAADQKDIDNIQNNFGGKPNTTVTILAGDGTGPNATGPATRAALEQALKDIGAQMNANEQFIFFAGDHGNAESVLVLPEDTEVGTQAHSLDAPALSSMLDDPDNQPQLSFFSQQQITLPSIQNLTFNGIPLNWQADFTEFMLDYNDNGFAPGPTEPDLFKYTALIPEPLIMPTGNSVAFFYSGPGPLPLEGISLESGAIARLSVENVPEPTSIAIWSPLGLAFCGFAYFRNQRKKRFLGFEDNTPVNRQ